MKHLGRLTTTSGEHISLGQPLTTGGQGKIYEAILQRKDIRGVVKLFKKQFATPPTQRRIEYLVNASLSQRCSVISAPTHLIASKGNLGHFTPFAHGIHLEKLLQSGNVNLVQGVQLALAITTAIEVLHGKQIAHGDLHSENILVETDDENVVKPHLIDLDNFNAAGQPPPDMIGQNLYLAPEQRIAMAQGRLATPDIHTDRFSLGVLIHEILLLKHPATGADDDELSFQQAMSEGRWLHDPGNGGSLLNSLGGYPSGIVGSTLSRYFRRSMSLDRETRPTALEWKTSLQHVLNEVYACPHCGGSFIVDPYSNFCSHCKQQFPVFQLQTPNGNQFLLDRAAMPIGRETISGDPTVSARHAVFRRRGPLTYIETRGRNGTSRWNGKKWVRLPDGYSIAVRNGDKLRFGNSEVLLKELC